MVDYLFLTIVGKLSMDRLIACHLRGHETIKSIESI